MRQATIIALVLAAAAPALTGQSDTTWAPTRKKAFQYADSSGLWRVVGGLPLDEAIRTYEQAVRTDNPYLNAARFWPGYQIMLDEPGDWYVFGVGMRPGYSLLLSAESTVTLVDKSGKTITGHMRLLRPDDDAARTVFDVWKAPLIVYPGPFMHGSSGPTVIVRFPLGSVKWKNIRGITAGGVRVLRMEGG